MNIPPQHIILELLNEAWPNGEPWIVHIQSDDIPNYFKVFYYVKDKSGEYVLNIVSYGYSLHIQPRMELWREKRINNLVNKINHD